MLEYDQKWCTKILDRLLSWKIAQPFVYPVDPKRDNAPDYYTIVTKPICFDTIRERLRTGKYESAEQFKDDIEQLCENGIRYNGSNTLYGMFCLDMRRFLRRKFSTKPTDEKDEWFKKLAKASAALRDHLKNAPPQLTPAPV